MRQRGGKLQSTTGDHRVVITKLDSDIVAAALSIRQVTGAPIKFTGTGEN